MNERRAGAAWLTVLLAALCAAGLLALFVLPLAFAAGRGSTQATAGSALLTLLLAAGFGVLLWQRLRLAGRQAASDRYIRSLLDTSVDPMVVLDASDFRLLDANRAAETVTGYSRAELLGMSAAELRLPEDRPGLAGTVARARATGGTATPYPLTWLRKDGSHVAMEFTNGATKLGGRAVVVATGRDVTARLRAEAELQRSQRRFRALIENAAEIVTVIDATGTIVYQSPSLERVLGRTPEETIGGSVLRYADPADVAALRPRIAVLATTPGEILVGSVRIQHADGSWRVLEIVASNLLNDPAVAGIVLNSRDVTKRVQSEAAEGHRTAYLAALHEAALAVGSELDPHAALNTIVTRAAAALDSPAGSIMLLAPDGESLLTDVSIGDARKFEGRRVPRGGLAGRALDTSQSQTVQDYEEWEGRLPEALRGVRPGAIQALVATPLISRGQPLGVISLSRSQAGRPYTAAEVAALEQFAQIAAIALENARLHAALQAELAERTRAEAEVRRVNAKLEQRVAERTAELAAANAELAGANKELESFTYTASHDLRAPLRTIDGFSRIVLEDYGEKLPAEAQRFLNTVREGAQQMARLIDDLLAFSRVGRQPLTKRPVQPRAIVEQVLAELSVAQRGERLQICLGELPPAEADPALLKQVYTNLLSNALKYSRPRARAEIEIGAEDGAVPVYFVRDNGVGFDERYANKLFGAFQRLHRQEEFEGTGVGLAIVQRIVHRHGGRVWARGKLDAGATFSFTLAPSPILSHSVPRPGEGSGAGTKGGVGAADTDDGGISADAPAPGEAQQTHEGA